MEIAQIEGIFSLDRLIDYVSDTISSVIIAKNDKMIFALKAFDAGQTLPTHNAPGNAIFTVLEGSALVTLGCNDYLLTRGQSILFPKGAPHSVFCKERAKISLLIDMA